MSKVLNSDEYVYGMENEVLAGRSGKEQYRAVIRETLSRNEDEFFDSLELGG